MRRWASNIRYLFRSQSAGLSPPAHPPRRYWLPLAVLGAIAIAVVAWRVSLDVLPLALSADDRLTEFRGLSVTDLDSRDGEALAELRAKVDRIQSEARPAAWSMRWLAHFSPALAWVPALDHEFAAWSAQASRLQSDLQSADALLTASSQLLVAYGEAQAALLSPKSGPPSPLLGTQARDLEATFIATIDRADEAARAGRRHGPAIGTPRVRHALTVLEDAEAQLGTALRIGRQASGLLAELLEVGSLAQPLVAQFIVEDGYDPEPLSVEDLRSILADLDSRIQFTMVKSDALSNLIANSRDGGQLLDRVDLLHDVLGVLLSVNRATAVGLQALGPAIMGPGDAGAGLLTSEGGLLRALDGLAGHADRLSEAVTLLEDAQAFLTELEARGDRTGLPNGTSELAAGVSLLHEGLQLALAIGPIGADLLGAGSTQRYLVLGQSADELRATGGFVSSVWLVTFEDGALAGIDYHDTVRVDDWDRLSHYPPAPSGLEEHMNARVWLLRDVSWEPDFPTTARIAADMFKIGQRQEVDGVAAINQWTLLSLLEALGGVPSPDGGAPITPRNLFSNLERGTDQYGRTYMDLVLQGVLERLNEPADLSTMIRLASALNESLRGGDLLLFLDDPDAQAVIAASRWDGRVQRDSMDYLYIIDSNVGWSKSDRNIERSVSYQVDLRRDAGVRINLELGYNNHSGPGSPGCEPQWLNRGTNYNQLKNACYWDYWRVYTPQGANLLSNTPLDLPEYSVSVEIGKGQPGDDTVRVSSSFNRTVYSGLFALEAGAAREVTLVYDLPPGLIDRDQNAIDYELLIQKQPGIRSRAITVELLLPPGFTLASSSVAPAFKDDTRVRFTLQIERDTVLGARFTRDDGAS